MNKFYNYRSLSAAYKFSIRKLHSPGAREIKKKFEASIVQGTRNHVISHTYRNEVYSTARVLPSKWVGRAVDFCAKVDGFFL